jgi:predicted MFS family arabinose efflux permease
MVNAMGRERGALFTLEQAVLPGTTTDRHRTQILAWYNTILDIGQALGSLLGGVPFLLRQRLGTGGPVGTGEIAPYQWAFVLYGGLACLSVFLYLGLSPRVEVPAGVPEGSGPPVRGMTPWLATSARSRRIITRLSLLFGLDSFAGGFLPASLIAYWFFKRFGVGGEILGPLFFAAHVANAVSYLAAAWLARRIGLVNTMVFTHIPAQLSLMAIPFAPTVSWAVLLYLTRECLVEMDVPSRQSYLMAVVAPEERTLASGVTNLTRLIAWTIAPGLAGFAMKSMMLHLPLFFGGGLKIIYDVALYLSFRRLKPPEER